ncbi:ABC transporter ATP-binding protein [Sporosarcina sp. P21c]|uniref:ABC transporter ATP-binding protein n=1 Tax=Sporosarcina TaxID=1569 RepID=UPI000A15655E|nr:MULTISPECIES: ABC transporter ATP-binding protein [Sporosarcina]ARJ39685.1 iron ABC transporter ATP-binding protein [Sporosarcina ureae]PIC82477.1 ABC transporter ATP-binding protein [Sporosarcina sp. P1]PIC89071.1 ABC transporter ATP-binding protein [Sporosarcina sp. P21c]
MLITEELSYRHSDSFELTSIDLHIKQGEIVSLLGPNGSGKSTFLRLISRLITPGSGEVLLNGERLKRMKSQEVARNLAMLPQMQDHQLDVTVGELVEFGRHPHRSGYGKLSREDQEIIDWAIGVTKLEKYKNRMLQSLSGGERQRAWIAMAIAQRPKVLLLDEPTTYLDISHQLEVMELVMELNEMYGMTVIMVLHDINQAASYSDRLIVLKDGNVRFDGIPQCVLCKEMFHSIFEIDAEIFMNNGKCFFTPSKLEKGECYENASRKEATY